ncbi:hypothetical protein [Actinomadura gamaensis]|uniref:Uncharacterized protein n=1 Tax=Actinomadura gamaensis TaxID=1763541 RepID=A0ABV9U0L5_9ACTN
MVRIDSGDGPSPGIPHFSPRPGGVTKPGEHDSRLQYRYLLGVDVAGYSRLSALDQARTQRDLDWAISLAAERTGMDREAWLRQVAGDGELAVLPAGTDGLRLVVSFPRELGRALDRVNRTRLNGQRIRVRLTLHHGTLMAGPFGPVGQAPIVVARLLEAQQLRDALAADGTDLVLMVSESIYVDVVQTRLEGLDPDRFEPITVEAKELTYRGYLYRGLLYTPTWSSPMRRRWPRSGPLSRRPSSPSLRRHP